MNFNKNAKSRNQHFVNGKSIIPVAIVEIKTTISYAPHMAHDAHIEADTRMENNPLLQPGKRYGDWSQVRE